MENESKGLAIASMVCGIAADVLMCCGIFGGILALLLGAVALVLGIMYKKKGGTSGMALAGIICGSIGLVVGVLWIAYVLVMIIFYGGIAGIGILSELANM